MLLPDLSALLSLKQPLKPEVTSPARRPGGDGQLGGTSTSSDYCNNGWKRRRYRRGPARTLDGNKLGHIATDNNGTVRRCWLFSFLFKTNLSCGRRLHRSVRRHHFP